MVAVASQPKHNERCKCAQRTDVISSEPSYGVAHRRRTGSYGGIPFNMSVVTTPALNALPPQQVLAGWKGINATVRNPLFLGTAFGTAALSVACTPSAVFIFAIV